MKGTTMADRINLPFNPDTMPIRDAKRAVESLRILLQNYNRLADEVSPEEFTSLMIGSLMQLDAQYSTN